MKKDYTTAEVSKLAGVHRDTLLRWLREGRIPEPKRDRHGWRIFSDEDLTNILYFTGNLSDEDGTTITSSILNKLSSTTEAIERLNTIDWDFHDSKTNYLTHGLHPYPAKFIPQIPNALIQELSSVGDTVVDIFCGSGTTLVESLLLKRNAIGVDANPLACLISHAKTVRLSEDDVTALDSLLLRACRLEPLASNPGPDLFGSVPFHTQAPIPEDDAVHFWFYPFVVHELAELRSYIANLPPRAKLLASASFSSIIVAVSKQDSDTRYVRREKNIAPGDTTRRFIRALSDAKEKAIEFSEATEPRFSCVCINADILDAPDIGAVDIVVTSPPYPNAYSYHLYHKTRMLWLGMDSLTFKQQEIGSHRKYSLKGPNGADESTFTNELSSVFKWLKS
ncbi:MAG: DNA methyltransferase, partial [Nitrospirota bacterium]